jgi:hypothetical protein
MLTGIKGRQKGKRLYRENKIVEFIKSIKFVKLKVEITHRFIV